MSFCRSEVCGAWWCGWRFFFCKQKTAYELRISDWSSDVCSSGLVGGERRNRPVPRVVFALQGGGAPPVGHIEQEHRRAAFRREDARVEPAVGARPAYLDFLLLPLPQAEEELRPEHVPQRAGAIPGGRTADIDRLAGEKFSGGRTEEHTSERLYL